MLYHKIKAEHIETASSKALAINGYNQEVWNKEAVDFLSIADSIRQLIDGKIVIGHNVGFDLRFIDRYFAKLSLPPIVPFITLDTVKIARKLKKAGLIKNRTLKSLCDHFHIAIKNQHTAKGDVLAIVELFIKAKLKINT
jgi:DNA polymerase III epsilon subunit-like protein